MGVAGDATTVTVALLGRAERARGVDVGGSMDASDARPD